MGKFDITKVPNDFFDYVEVQEDRINSSDFLKASAACYEARKKYSVEEKTILYESYFGRGMICNPFALFSYMLNDSSFKDFKHIWVLDKTESNEHYRRQYADYENVIFVEPESEQYFEWLSKAKYLLNNVTFKPYFAKKKNQIVVNTWHGIPLKHMGYDEVDGKLKAANMVRNFLFTDFIVSPSEYTTKLFKNAYKLENIYAGKYIEAGSPRIDLSFNTDKESLIAEMKTVGVNVDSDKEIVVYAPTWTGSYDNPDIDQKKYDDIINEIELALGKDKYQVLFKPHQIVYKYLEEASLMKDNYIPAIIDTNRLLSLTDILITDYSSIFFDYLPLNRKIVFYITDYASYENERGVYFDIDSLPGPVCRTMDDLIEVLRQIDNIDSLYNKNNLLQYKSIVSKEDGEACKRIIDTIFFGNDDYIIEENLKKKRLLFHTDIVLRNGISSSLLNLLNLIDTNKYDVTFYAIGNRSLVREYVYKLPDSVRVLYRSSGISGDVIDCARRFYCTDHAIVDIDDHRFPDYLYKTEFSRCFGDVHFDCIINFSGFSSFYVNILRFAEDSRQLIWMHNVMTEEYERISEGKKVFETTLNNVFKIYPELDMFISCSETTMLHNRKDLATKETYDKFDYLSNSINTKNIFEGKERIDTLTVNERQYLILESSNNGITKRIVPYPKEDAYNFVCMGRLADAKNHENLIKAFARVVKEHSNSMLYIIGDGPLQARLNTVVNSLGLHNNVILTGNISNPFALMSKCDCFVLPSYYEGQPMVILEARCLGLSIIESDFDTVKDSMLPNGQLIIGTSIEEIHKGLLQYINGEVPSTYKFDSEEYNLNIANKFYSLVEKKEQ